MAKDGLWDVYNDSEMGVCGELYFELHFNVSIKLSNWLNIVRSLFGLCLSSDFFFTATKIDINFCLISIYISKSSN